jgi:hypothetical protein
MCILSCFLTQNLKTQKFEGLYDSAVHLVDTRRGAPSALGVDSKEFEGPKSTMPRERLLV